jgi:hypothetical protein
MVLTETMNYHATHIGAIRTNKERIKSEFNVGINITRRRYGEYQEVDITGSTKDIRNCKKTLQCVVEQAEDDYQEYLTRKRRREDMKPKQEFKLPKKFAIKKKPNTNPFAALEFLECIEGLSKDVEESSYEKSFPPISTYDPNVSWGDMSDDEE